LKLGRLRAPGLYNIITTVIMFHGVQSHAPFHLHL